MKFKFLTNEIEEVLNLINSIFESNAKKENFKLLDNQRVLLLKNGDEVIGCTIITLKNDPIKNTKSFYLDYVCISRNYQHQGLGRKMFKEVERIAINEGIDSLQLTSSTKRDNARKMYISEGMEIVETNLFKKNLKLEGKYENI